MEVYQSNISNIPSDNTFENVSEIQNYRTSPQNSKSLAVHMNHGFKSYGKVAVLKDLNLHVPEGAIYGLLGASGSGKTTILKCVVGRMTLDTGSLVVFGKQPGSRGHLIPGRLVGYMPQEIALYKEFTIDETLTFFGFLHGMKSVDVKKRRDFLMDFLDLPDKNRLVKNLSGGQQRRVSMSIALLQEPKLLILDEPTVGVDPLLREKIWDHLIDISKTSNTTIIITTHYIEEARKADYVGFIRYGRILAEQPPENLMRIHNEPSLESVFLKLCSRDQDHNVLTSKTSETSAKNPVYESSDDSFVNTPKVSPLPIQPNPESTVSKIIEKGKSYISKSFRLPKMNNFLGLLYKDSILIRRNLGFLIFQFFIPVIQMSLFCLCIGREPYNLKFGIVNNETIYNSTGNSSWLYVNALSDKTFDKTFLNWSEAYERTKKAELWGFIDLSANFTSDTTAKFIFHQPNQTYPGSNINVYLDSSNQQIAYTIQLSANEAYQVFLQSFLGPFIDPSLFASPVIIQQPVYGDKDPQFISFMAPGIMVTIIFTLTIGLTALMFVIEKKEGLLDRGWAAGVSTLEIMMAHVASKLLIMTVQITLLILITSLAFGVKIKGPVIWSALLLLLQGFCGMSYGLAISAGADNESDVMQIAIGSVFPALLLSGIIWPLEGMPHWVRMIANFSPLTHSAEAMRSIASRGWNLLNYPVWFGFVTVLGWSFFFDLIALIVFSATQG